jgi:hypothetical protein
VLESELYQTDVDLFRGKAVPCLTKTPERDMFCARVANDVTYYEETGQSRRLPLAIFRLQDRVKVGRKQGFVFPAWQELGDLNFVQTEPSFLALSLEKCCEVSREPRKKPGVLPEELRQWQDIGQLNCRGAISAENKTRVTQPTKSNSLCKEILAIGR